MTAFLFAAHQLPARTNSNKPSTDEYVSVDKTINCFVLSESGKTAPLVIDSNDFPGVIRVAGNVQDDLTKVTGARPDLMIGTFRRPEKLWLPAPWAKVR